LAEAPVQPSDQLVIADVTYDASDPSDRFMRARLYLFERLFYYDFFFHTSGAHAWWWWLISDPAAPDRSPTKAFGPFATTATVPPPDLLRANNLTHAGSWAVRGRNCDAFSGMKTPNKPIWYWFDEAGNLSRILNYDACNEFEIAIFGAYFLADFPTFNRLASSTLTDIYALCSQSSSPAQAPSKMVSLLDILGAMAAPPSGTQTRCTLREIQRLIPGVAPAPDTIVAPSWAHRVRSDCIMIGQLTSAYYSQVWYDWDRGIQITVFVWPDNAGSYSRMDQRLPGPGVFYKWDPSKCVWVPDCQQPTPPGGHGIPRPNFIETDGGTCRAIIEKNRYFGTISIWTAPLRNQNETSEADFWLWFNDRDQGVIFSRAPASSLTLTDYQTFVRDAKIDACIFDDPTNEIPVCPTHPSTVVANAPTFVRLLQQCAVR
jgi:hypothetical protein